MQITRSGIDTPTGPEEWFSGDVYIDPIAAPPPPARVQANLVHFTPGARTAWHTHPLGQTIYFTEGVGLCQSAAAPWRSSVPATASSSSPTRTTGSAAPNRFMVHVALNEVDDGHPAAQWGDKVTDDEYTAAPAP